MTRSIVGLVLLVSLGCRACCTPYDFASPVSQGDCHSCASGQCASGHCASGQCGGGCGGHATTRRGSILGGAVMTSAHPVITEAPIESPQPTPVEESY